MHAIQYTLFAHTLNITLLLQLAQAALDAAAHASASKAQFLQDAGAMMHIFRMRFVF
jgi:hypothetical protein